MANTDLIIRRKPSQARALETFEHILQTAVILLEEEGWDGFTTNLLAKRAGIGMQTLYRYFPNKLSVIATLAERMVEEWDSWYDDFDQRLGAGDALDDLFDIFIDGLKRMPGGVAVRKAMAASPALRRIDQEDNERLARRFADAMVKHGRSVNRKDAEAYCRMLIEAGVAIVDLSFEKPPGEAKALLRHARAMFASYSREVMIGPTERGRKK